MSERKLAKAHARWEAATRVWAADTARVVLRAICSGRPLPLTPYHVGGSGAGRAAHGRSSCPDHS
jgi:hypothetical protein